MTRMPRLLIAFFIMALAAASCGSTTETVDSTTSSSAATTTVRVTTTTEEPTSSTDQTTAEPTTSTTTTTLPPEVEEVVNVYWAGSVITPAGTPERLLAGGRIITTATPDRSAIEALLEGPNELETEIGMFNSIPAGTTLLDLSVTDGVAVVDLSSEFEASSGSLDEFIRAGQVVFTLTQFDWIDAVTFSIDGEERDDLGSHGIDVSSPLDRSDFESIRAFILPERPYPGAQFQSGDVISGESNTFEANVQWVVTDGDGLIIGEGFTTATNGNGTWGRFDVAGILDAETAGLGAVIVFEISAKDGSQLNIVEYPIELVGA